MDLTAEVVTWLTSLRVHKFRGEPRPHKAVLLLAVLELAETGRLAENCVTFGSALFEFFDEYWRAVAGDEVGKVDTRIGTWSRSRSGTSFRFREWATP